MSYRQKRGKHCICPAPQADCGGDQSGLDSNIFQASSVGVIEANSGFGFTANAFHLETVWLTGGPVTGQLFQHSHCHSKYIEILQIMAKRYWSNYQKLKTCMIYAMVNLMLNAEFQQMMFDDFRCQNS